MSNERMVMTLGKVLIAMAWADGNVSTAEINCLKDLLFNMPTLTGRQWERLQIYIEAPVEPEERSRLLVELQQAISSNADKSTALSVLETVYQADSQFTEDEQLVFAEIKESISLARTGLSGAMSKLLRGAIQRRTEVVSNAPNREEFFEDFLRNKIYYKLARRLDVDQAQLEIPDSELRKLCAASGLMAQIAYADDEIAEEEFDVICQSLQRMWGLSAHCATLVAEIAISEVGAGMDLHRLAREFFEATNQEERRRFIEVLFAVADAHDGTSHEEIEEVRRISKSLLVSHREFIQAKTKRSSK